MPEEKPAPPKNEETPVDLEEEQQPQQTASSKSDEKSEPYEEGECHGQADQVKKLYY
jgi:hypothetical protein